MAKIKYHSAEAVKELRKLVQEFKNLNNTVNSAGTAGQVSLSKIESKLFSIQMLSGKTVAALNRLTASVDKGTAAQTANSKAIEYQLKLANVYNKKVADGTRLNKANTNSVKRKTSAFKALKNTFGLFLGLNFFKKIAKGVFNQAKDFDSLNFSMKAVTDTAFDLAASQRFLLRISEDYGVELLSTSQRYVKFLAAAQQSNISLNDTEKIFGKVTKAAAVLGLKTDELNGVYLALEQMLSKGKVTTEELRRQLGERLPGAMGIMAAALNVSIPKLDEMLRKGEVLSAETLPKFADAVEVAFGVESLTKVENLAAAQNRFVNVWQQWISDVSRDKGLLNAVLTVFLGKITNILSLLAVATGSHDLQFKLSTIEVEKNFEAELKQRALEAVEKANIEIIDYDKRLQDKRNEILLVGETSRVDLIKKTIKERQAILRQEESNIIKDKIKQKDLLESYEKIEANKDLKLALSNYVNLKKMTDKSSKLLSNHESEKKLLLKKIKDNNGKTVVKEDGTVVTQKYLNKLSNNIAYEKKFLKEHFANLAEWEGKYNVIRKKLQESDPEVINNDDGGNKNRLKNLKDIKDLSIKIQIERFKNEVKINKDLIDSDKITFAKKRLLLEHNAGYEKRIAELIKDESIALNKQKLESTKKSLKKDLDNKKILKKDYENQIKLLDKEFDQKKELSKIKLNKSLLDIDSRYFSDLEKLNKSYQDSEINAIKDKYNKQLIINQKIFDSSKKTAKDFEKLEKSKKELAVAMANEIIKKQIEFLKNIIKTGNLSQEAVEAINKAIRRLEASKKNLAPDEKDVISWQEWAQKIGEVISEVGNFVDALYDRKIEAIEAEIAAEEAKYDKLIKLAENDAKEKEALEKQKADKIAILEKERLKQEQEAAKARKKFAIAEIIINTAVGISKAIPNPFLIALAASLGAVQLATVLATPIPQYKDGLDNAKSDHIAMINDGGKKEYVERNGKILSTNTKNAIVNLKKNDTVHKDYESMQKNSKIYSIIANGEILKQNEFDKLANIMESSIIKGFSKAKVNASFKNINKSTNNYLKQKARFNG